MDTNVNNKSGGKIFLVVLLTLILTGGLVFAGFFLGREFSDKSIPLIEETETEKTEEKEENKTEEKVYSYDEIDGVYEYKVTAYNEESEQEETNGKVYTLGSDGIFSIDVITPGPAFGLLGNYILDGDKILLYTHFATGSDITVSVVEKSSAIELKINEDGTLTEVDKDGNKNTLKKTSDKYNSDIFMPIDGYITYMEEELEEFYTNDR